MASHRYNYTKITLFCQRPLSYEECLSTHALYVCPVFCRIVLALRSLTQYYSRLQGLHCQPDSVINQTHKLLSAFSSHRSVTFFQVKWIFVFRDSHPYPPQQSLEFVDKCLILKWSNQQIFLPHALCSGVWARDHSEGHVWRHCEGPGQRRSGGGELSGLHLWSHQRWQDLHILRLGILMVSQSFVNALDQGCLTPN